jgi:hypothetical protein
MKARYGCCLQVSNYCMTLSPLNVADGAPGDNAPLSYLSPKSASCTRAAQRGSLSPGLSASLSLRDEPEGKFVPVSPAASFSPHHHSTMSLQSSLIQHPRTTLTVSPSKGANSPTKLQSVNVLSPNRTRPQTSPPANSTTGQAGATRMQPLIAATK